MQAALAAIISWDARGLPPQHLGPGVTPPRGSVHTSPPAGPEVWVCALGGEQGEAKQEGGEDCCCPLELGKEGGPKAWQVPLLAGLEISK